ncbi:LLM class flavin-dependent oxidoreductase [Sodalis sp. RH16]|jgi:alkanesulfonate monooxygenase SsuD/methylene tetrahydromethanopterin reductase-like flavin-dependent oxidoreductase (luciferase family)|uniref:LLM class flavin-dependent oxidoreductase n=1 Tax=unclassified Sodalis (in: enterobacteria) TaxID=2636512 RepID=UPI0039B517C9
MKLGLFNLMSYQDNPQGIQGVINDMRSMVGLAEEIGFETAWFAEHHFSNYSISVSPLLMAAHMAGYCRRIKLGTAVIVLPLYEPMRLAQEIALVDRLTDGRLVLGIGSGYQAYEFDRYGMDVARRNDILLDKWAFIESALVDGQTETLSWQGQHIKTDFLLRPLQQPLPPVFITTAQPALLQRFSRWRPTAFMTAGWRGSPRLKTMVDDARREWHEAGLPADTPVAVQQYIHVTDSKKAALEAAERALFVARMIAALHGKEMSTEGAFIHAPKFPDEPDASVIRDNLIIGDAQHVAERIIQEVKDLNPSHYNCFFQFGDMPIAAARQSLEKFGLEVIPLLERALGKVTVDIR